MLTPKEWEKDLQEYHERLYAEPQFICSLCGHELPQSFAKDPGICFLCSPLTEAEQEDLNAYL